MGRRIASMFLYVHTSVHGRGAKNWFGPNHKRRLWNYIKGGPVAAAPHSLSQNTPPHYVLPATHVATHKESWLVQSTAACTQAVPCHTCMNAARQDKTNRLVISHVCYRYFPNQAWGTLGQSTIAIAQFTVYAQLLNLCRCCMHTYMHTVMHYSSTVSMSTVNLASWYATLSYAWMCVFITVLIPKG